MIGNIIFDLGKVQVDYNIHWLLDELSCSHEKAVWFNENVADAEWRHAADRGNKPWKDFISGLKNDRTQYVDVVGASDQRYQEMTGDETESMRQLLAELKAQGYRLWGLGSRSGKIYYTIRNNTFLQMLDDRFISSEVHPLKPEKAIYDCFLRKFHLKADECIFIDKRQENIDCAQSAGIKAILFTGAQQLCRQIRTILPHIRLRKAGKNDLEKAWSIVREAALHMKETGRHQCGADYPSREHIEKDFKEHSAYTLQIQGCTVGYVSLSFNGESAYNNLRGRWLTEGPYAVIHRMAIDLKRRCCGWGRTLLLQCEAICRRHVRSIRVDTKCDNIEMLHLLESVGYRKCGTVNYLHYGNIVERIAFEKTL